MATVEVIEDLDAAEALASAWDELAVAGSLPLCAPGWMLSWWKHLAPAEGQLRVIAVRDGPQLIGVAPWFLQTGATGRVDVRFLGAELSDRVDILCAAGREREVAVALRGALGGLRPRPHLLAFEAVPIASRWSARLAGGLGGRMRLGRYRNSALPAPAVVLPQGPPEAWLASRSSNFRSQMGRLRRRLAKQGGTVRLISDPTEAEGALEAMLKLHADRWEGRAPSGLTSSGVPGLLRDASAALGADRLRLWTAEIDGSPVSVQLFLAAGDEVKYWNGGWSEEHADLKPSMLTILAALEDAISRGERRLDLGVGSHAYKMRFANSEDTLTWGGLVVHGPRWLRTRVELMPMVMRYRGKSVVRRLPAAVGGRLESVLRGTGGQD